MASSDLLKEFGFKEEKAEQTMESEPTKTGYPKPINAYRFVFEAFNLSIEETYFWLLNHLRIDLGFPEVAKVVDVFSGSVTSTFWGQIQQRLGIQQDRVATYLKYISDMVKALFQIVREIKVIDERLDYYEKSYKGEESSEVVLKGYWVDLVEGGIKNPASVYGLSREVGFAILPDLFFSTKPMKSDNIDKYVDGLKYNRKVREVLKRKLKQYLTWKEHTYKELKTRRSFTIKYLKQHYNTIRMYMNWIKPYLFYVRRLSGKTDAHLTPDVVSAFETAILDLEFIAKKPVGKDVYACILAHFHYTTKPSMEFVQPPDYQHKGPIHVGRVEVSLKAYAWTKQEFDNYLKMKEKEDLEILGDVDATLKEIFDALGDDLRNYLEEKGEKIEEKKEEKPKQPSVLDPFTSLFKGFGDIFSRKEVSKSKSVKKKGWEAEKVKESFEINELKKKATKTALSLMWLLYKNYKKSHGLLNW